jgi:DNA primase
MPLVWDEVNDSLDPKAFTIKNAVERMEKLGTDPVLAVLETKADLLQVLENIVTLGAS